MIRAICFDLDDTLYPYEEYVRAGFRAAADALASAVEVDVYEDLVAAYDAGVRRQTFDHVLAANDLPQRYVGELVDAFHDQVGLIEPYPGVPTLLDRLAEEYRLAVITDGRNGREKLAALGLDGAFESVWVSPERGISKRQPEPFEETLSLVGVSPEEAAYVGDHPRIDLAVPNALGMHTVRIRQGRFATVPSVEAPATELPSIGSLGTVFGVGGCRTHTGTPRPTR